MTDLWAAYPKVQQGAGGDLWAAFPKVQPGAIPAQQPAQQPTAQPEPTLQQRAQEVFGFEDYAERGTILPFGRTKEGELELALPQVAVDMATSFLLPGHVAQGGEYTPQDVTRFAMDFAAPATARATAAGPKSTAPAARDIIRDAPSTEQLSRQGSAGFKEVKGSGVALNPERYADFLGGLEQELAAEGIDPMLHKTATAVFNAMSKRLGDEVDIGDLQTIRRQIGIASNSVTPELADERRIADIMRDRLDEMIDGLTEADVVSGNPAGAPERLREARSLWSRAKKSEIVENVIEKAKLQASGFENGLRIGFRQLLKNPKLRRGFTEDELSVMRQVVEGTTGTKMMRLLGKLSFLRGAGSNFLGGSIGTGAGYAAGGPIGAAIPPAIGYVAQKGADAATRQRAELVRALAATGSQVPAQYRQLVDALMGVSTPVAGAMVPQQDR